MIIDPDFLDHWRTGMVVDALGDAMAPIYIMRLWAHCQERKSDTFAMPTRGLKAQCKFPGDADKFEASLIEAGFIARDGDSVHVLGWAEKNASLLAAWDNGAKGGRPPKARQKNPEETHGKPMGNPAVTHGKPMANPDETDKRREEKRREEGAVPDGTGAGAPPAPADVIFARGVPLLCAAGVSDRNARSMLGLMRKTHGDTAVIGAVQRCAEERPLEPVAWLQAALKQIPPSRSRRGPLNDAELAAANAASTAEAARLLGFDTEIIDA